MADTWRATAQTVTFASGKSMLDIFNGGAATRVIRAPRMYQFNNSTGAVTGVLTEMRITRITAASAGSSVTPVAHDTGNTALEAALTAGSGRTVTTSDLFRKYIWSNDEPAVSGSSIDEWEMYIPFASVWEAGYGDTNVQALTCRATQGVQILHQGSTVVGSNDFEIEFTNAAS